MPIINDTALEPDETFTVTLTSPVNATLGGPSRHAYTIDNDEFPHRTWQVPRALSTDAANPAAVVTANDFDGDGRSDYGVFDAASGLWSLRLSTDGDVTVQFGSVGSVPVTGDFDGDGRSDYGVFDAASGPLEPAAEHGRRYSPFSSDPSARCRSPEISTATAAATMGSSMPPPASGACG